MTRSLLSVCMLMALAICLPAIVSCRKKTVDTGVSYTITPQILAGDSGRVWRLAPDPSLVKTYTTHYTSQYTGRDIIRFDSVRYTNYTTQFILFNTRSYVISDSLAATMSLARQGSWSARFVGPNQINAIFLVDARLDMEAYFFTDGLLRLSYGYYDATRNETISYELNLYPGR